MLFANMSQKMKKLRGKQGAMIANAMFAYQKTGCK